MSALRDYRLVSKGVASSNEVLAYDIPRKLAFETALANILQDPAGIPIEDEAKKITFGRFREIVGNDNVSQVCKSR